MAAKPRWCPPRPELDDPLDPELLAPLDALEPLGLLLVPPIPLIPPDAPPVEPPLEPPLAALRLVSARSGSFRASLRPTPERLLLLSLLPGMIGSLLHVVTDGIADLVLAMPPVTTFRAQGRDQSASRTTSIRQSRPSAHELGR